MKHYETGPLSILFVLKSENCCTVANRVCVGLQVCTRSLEKERPPETSRRNMASFMKWVTRRRIILLAKNPTEGWFFNDDLDLSDSWMKPFPLCRTLCESLEDLSLVFVVSSHKLFMELLREEERKVLVEQMRKRSATINLSAKPLPSFYDIPGAGLDSSSAHYSFLLKCRHWRVSASSTCL